MSRVGRDRLLLAAPLLGLVALAVLTPSDEGPTICPFALCTGTACPGCGMTRAASSLVHGDVGRALRYHPLVLLVMAQLLIGWAWFALARMGRVRPPGGRVVNAALIVTGVALLAVWVVRLASGTLPPV